MDEELKTLLIGIIFIILAINTTAIWALSSTVYGGNTSQKAVFSEGGVTAPVQTTVKATPAPTGTAAKTDSKTTPASKTTTAAVQATKTGKATLQPTTVTTTLPAILSVETPVYSNSGPASAESSDRSAEADYVTIYSLKDQVLGLAMPVVSVNLINPPLVIDYTVTPVNVTDIKYFEYKLKNKWYYENRTVSRPYENSWFLVNVTDKNTGILVDSQGYGQYYNPETTQRLMVYQSGNYRIEFTGQFGNVTLTMKVPPEGNIK